MTAGSISILAGVLALSKGEDNYGKIQGKNIVYVLQSQAREFGKDRKLRLLSLRTVFCHVPFVAFVLFWQIYATEIIQIKMKYLAFLLLIFMLLLMAGNYAVSIVARKMNTLGTSVVGILISILGFFLLIAFFSIPSFVIGAGLVEFGFGMEQAATRTWMCDHIKSETRSTYSSIFSTVQSLAGFFIMNLLGLLTEWMGVRTAWIVAAVAMGVDIVILVVASDDGVMPQTLEALNHAKEANVPIIVAVNKMDLPNASMDKVKAALSEYGLTPEEWGGDTQYIGVSALHKTGIKELLEAIILQAEMLELKANPNREAIGIVLEASLEQGRGPVGTVLVQNGTLKIVWQNAKI